MSRNRGLCFDLMPCHQRHQSPNVLPLFPFFYIILLSYIRFFHFVNSFQSLLLQTHRKDFSFIYTNLLYTFIGSFNLLLCYFQFQLQKNIFALFFNSWKFNKIDFCCCLQLDISVQFEFGNSKLHFGNKQISFICTIDMYVY